LRNAVMTAYPRLINTVWGERFITHVRVRRLNKEVATSLAQLPNVRSIHIDAARPSTKEQKELVLRGATQLPKASLADGVLELVLSPRHLRSIHIEDFILAEDSCRLIAERKDLRYVGVPHCELSERSLATLLSMPQLRQIDFSYCAVTGSDVQPASVSCTLEYIRCDHAPIGRDFAEFVIRSPRMTRLAVGGRTIDDTFVATLRSSRALRILELRETQMTDACVPVLESFSNLKLSISPIPFSASACEQLKKSGKLVP
jgi:hypothetical protein